MFDKSKYKIDVFATCYNEQFILPAFIKHYKDWFGANITIFDNESTDNSVKIAEDAGCRVIPYKTNGELSDLVYLKIKNNCWKSSNADWVIIVDMDEFLEMNFDIDRYTIINTNGYDVVGDLTSRRGTYNAAFCKHVMFSPKHIKEINYGPGAHLCRPNGFIQGSIEIAKLLHRKYISPSYVYEKHKVYEKRMSDLNKKYGWGKEYLGVTLREVKEKFNELKKNLIEV